MGMGTLMVETRAADEALPIEGAKVVISQNGRILAEMITDGNGQTKRIEIIAPDKAHSLDPNDHRPKYSMVDVIVTKPGFVEVDVDHVQIYDGVDAYLPIHMHPESDGWPKIEHYDVPPPAVEESGERNMISPPAPATAQLGQDLQPFVLNKVIVPDYITVHLGKPNDYARNVRVPFSEYIKNVTSSEIYPTWPHNSLLANIHAIVSFTLNRIFTEWYRSRGFPFDITNSTQLYPSWLIY